MDLIEFLAARLDEDEAAAKAVELRFPGPWERAENTDSPLPSAVTLYDSRDESVGVIRGSYAAAYIARHDPARALREVQAIRELLRHLTDPQTGDLWKLAIRLDDGRESALIANWLLRPFAAIWSDHPDYRDEWTL